MDTLSFLHKRKMKELKGQHRIDYLLKNVPVIFSLYREKNRFNKYYRQYLYNINQNQSQVRESLSLNEDNYCNDCQIYKRYNIDEGISFSQIVVKHLTYKLKLILNRLPPKHMEDMNIFANC